MAKVVALLGLLVAAAFAGLCSEDLVLYYTFDDAADLVADSTALIDSTHNATSYDREGSVSSSSNCPFGNCAAFDGDQVFYTKNGDDGVTMPNDSSLTAQVWFKVDPADWSANSYPMPLISNGGNARAGWVMSIRNVNTTASPDYVEGALSVGILLNATTGVHYEMASKVSVVTGYWTLATFVFDRDARWMRLYINGTQLNPTGALVPVLNSSDFSAGGYGDLSGLTSMPTFNSECPSSFGVGTVVGYVNPVSERKRDPTPCTTAVGFMIGEIDDVAVWKRVLTNAEILASVTGPACAAGNPCDQIADETQCPLSPRGCHWCGDTCSLNEVLCLNCTQIPDETACQTSLKGCTWCGGDCFDSVDSWRHCPRIESVHLPFGRVLGSTRDGTTAFYDIPYALPPVGTLRWQDPATWNRHYYQGVHDGTYSHNVTCAGASSYLDGTEDCLTLSIFVPERKRPSISTYSNAKLPVVIFLDGGLSFPKVNDKGYGYDARSLAKDLNAMVVEVNYRAGIFGWLALSSTDISGNYGAKDVLEAYSWLKNFAFRFGGDTKHYSKITLWGVARGATIAALLAQNELDISNLVLNSLAFNYRSLADSSTWATTNVVSNTVCTGSTGANLEACMRNLTFSELIDLNDPWVDDLSVFSPVYGDWEVPNGWLSEITVIGNSAQDAYWSLELAFGSSISDDQYKKLLTGVLGMSSGDADAFLSGGSYPKSGVGATNFATVQNLFRDIGICQTRSLIRSTSASPYYWYYNEAYSECQPGPFANFSANGGLALTGSELQFIFGNKPYLGCSDWTSNEVALKAFWRNNFQAVINGQPPSWSASSTSAANIMRIQQSGQAVDTTFDGAFTSKCSTIKTSFPALFP